MINEKRGSDRKPEPLGFRLVEVIGIDNATAMMTEGQ
jgi:hypothetical protein